MPGLRAGGAMCLGQEFIFYPPGKGTLKKHLSL